MAQGYQQPAAVCRDPLVDVAAFDEKGGNIVVGTPGRISDVMKRSKLIELRRLEVLVLDEADRLLDMGFRAQLDYIMGRLPKQRRTGESLVGGHGGANRAPCI